MPAKIENPCDGPAVSVDHAAFERCVDFARRGLHDCGAESLEEVAIHRRNTNLQTRQIRACYGLVQVEVKRIVVDETRKEKGFHFRSVELEYVVITEVLVRLEHWLHVVMIL